MRHSKSIVIALTLVLAVAGGTGCEGPAGASHYSTHTSSAGISDARVKKCLPPGASDISLHTQVNGHLAKYKISESEFHEFLDELWEASNKQSAHQRDEMSGEGEPPHPVLFEKRFEAAGWAMLEDAIQYHGPSKANGAMTTYYYDADAGIAFHDTGYW